MNYAKGIPTNLVERAIRNGATVFIETGYNSGDTIERIKDQFEQIYSIELSGHLYRKGVERHGSDKILIVQGDSAKKLGPILTAIRPAKALLWLDAHWSHGSDARTSATVHTAIRGELAALKAARDKHHTILIDDLTDFQGENGYPTVEELFPLIRAINPDYKICVIPGERRGVLEAIV